MTSIATLHARFLELRTVSTDTRDLPAGCLFFALKGPHFNANAFASQALEQGAAAVVVDDPTVVRDERYLLVPDVLQALQQLARHHRDTFRIPVLAITGTNGKTTTKELVHAVLQSDRATLATQGNLNNHIGVPLTLLRLNAEHRIAVIEMGANKPGDIAELCAIADPDHGLITNMGKAHLEGFGDFAGVVRTKSELYDHLRARQGHVFVHGEDPLLMERSAGIRRTTYGHGPNDALQGRSVEGSAMLTLRFGAAGSDQRTVTTRLVGAYNLPNALAAACIGLHFGVPMDQVVDALAAYDPGNSRSQLLRTAHNELILDAYNANPTSLRTALENFAALPTDRPKLAILGDMRELGAVAEAEHRAIVDFVRSAGIPTITVGALFAQVTEGSPIRSFADATQALAHLQSNPVRNHLVLVKGSRGIKLETVVPAL